MDDSDEESASDNKLPTTSRPDEPWVEPAERWPDVDYNFKLSSPELLLEMLPILCGSPSDRVGATSLR